MIQHEFTTVIQQILNELYGQVADQLLKESPILQYLNIKTRSASRGSKSRGSFANHYALYVLVEDYLNHGYQDRPGEYENYPGAKFTDLFRRQRELPFGKKLQNHALNHRLNEEFKRYFPTCEYIPILRNVEGRYWINENLLLVQIDKDVINIAQAIVRIIDAYVDTKMNAFRNFISECKQMQTLSDESPNEVERFIRDLMRPNVDARIFEIVSYAILKEYYGDQFIFWGWTVEELQMDPLTLYKTGRTNANDGGIDFVMKPLGRFFQVTETLDVEKYFLDIDKIHRYPLTFVVKSLDSIESISEQIKQQARRRYKVSSIVDRYMDSIEEIINIPVLLERFEQVINQGRLKWLIEEIARQSKVEFNYTDADDEDNDEDDD